MTQPERHTPTPARGYSWPTATPGNTIALKHGANSERAIAVRAAELRPRLFEIAPWLDPVLDVIAVDRFLRCEARSLMLDQHCLDPDASMKAQEQATAASRLAAQLGSTLGLDYRSRAHIRNTEADTAATLADLKAQGQATTGYQANAIGAEAVPEVES